MQGLAVAGFIYSQNSSEKVQDIVTEKYYIAMWSINDHTILALLCKIIQ